MLDAPIICAKVVGLALAGIIAMTPIANVAKINKDSNTTITDNGNSTTANNKTNEQTTRIITIREGFKGQLVDGQIFQIPFYQKTTVEKSYHEKEKEQQDSNSNKQQQNNTHSSEDVPRQKVTIISSIIDGTQYVVSKIWRKVKP